MYPFDNILFYYKNIMLEALYIYFILYEICVVTDGFMSYRNIHSEVTFMKYFDLKQTFFVSNFISVVIQQPL